MLVPKVALVFDRRGKADKKTKGSIDLRITYNRKQKLVSTGITCYPHQWKGGNPFVSGYENSATDNQMLTSILNRAQKIVSGMVDSGEVDIDAIPRLLKPSEGAGITLLQYIVKRLDRQNIQESTYRQKVTFYNKLSEYGKIKLFSDISEKAIRDFDEWLHRYEWTVTDSYGKELKKKYSQATIGSFHKNLKAFIADAVVDGYLKENIYVSKRIKVDKGGTRIDQYLTSDEIDRLLNAKMPTKSLSEARDLFATQIMTGMAYIQDMEEYGEVEGTFSFTYTYSDASKTAGTLVLTGQGYYGSTTILATFTIANNILYVTGNFFGYGASTTVAFNKI